MSLKQVVQRRTFLLTSNVKCSGFISKDDLKVGKATSEHFACFEMFFFF